MPQERLADGSPTGSHPAWEPHVIQGWTPDFIPKVLQEGIDQSFFDEVRPVDGVKGGLGIMADDVIAGLCAFLVQCAILTSLNQQILIKTL